MEKNSYVPAEISVDRERNPAYESELGHLWMGSIWQVSFLGNEALSHFIFYLFSYDLLNFHDFFSENYSQQTKSQITSIKYLQDSQPSINCSPNWCHMSFTCLFYYKIILSSSCVLYMFLRLKLKTPNTHPPIRPFYHLPPLKHSWIHFFCHPLLKLHACLKCHL